MEREMTEGEHTQMLLTQHLNDPQCRKFLEEGRMAEYNARKLALMQQNATNSSKARTVYENFTATGRRSSSARNSNNYRPTTSSGSKRMRVDNK